MSAPRALSEDQASRLLRVVTRNVGLLTAALILTLSPAAARGGGSPQEDLLPAQALTDAVPLELGRAVERELSGGGTHLYRVAVSAGQFMQVRLDMKGIEVNSSLHGPDGNRIVPVYSSTGDRGLEFIRCLATASGIHRLEVTAAEKDPAPGRYAIVLEVLRPAEEQDRRRVEAQQLVSEAHDLEEPDTSESRRQALAKYEAARKLWQSVGDRYEEGYALFHVGAIRYAEGELRNALEDRLALLSLWQSVGDKLWEGRALEFVADTYLTMDEYSLAKQYLAKTLEARRSAGDKTGESDTLYNIGSTHQRLGELQTALEFFEQSLDISAGGDRYGAAYSIGSIGQIYHALGEDDQAARRLLEALEIHRSLSNSKGEMWALMQLGRIRAATGEPQEALDCYEEALAIARRHANPIEVDLLNSIAALHVSTGEYERAIVEAGRALSLYVSAGSRSDRAIGLLHIGEALLGLKEFASARESLDEAMSLRDQLGDKASGVEVLYQRARVSRADGQAAEALRDLESAIAVVESLRRRITSPDIRAAYTATVAKTYELAIDILMSMHRQSPQEDFDVRAFEMNERQRARGLAELLGEIRADIREGVGPELLETERNLRVKIDAAVERRIRGAGQSGGGSSPGGGENEIARLQADYDRLTRQIRATSPRYGGLTEPAPMTLRQIQRTLMTPDTVLLEYALGESRSFLWAVTPEGLFTRELPGKARLEDLVRRVYSLLTARSRHVRFENPRERRNRIRQCDEEAARMTAVLADVALGPVVPQLQNRRLLIVTDGALNFLPLAALPVPGSAGRTPLGAAHEIVTLPSASILADLRGEWKTRPPPSKTLVVLADPVFEAGDARIRRAGAGAGRVDTPPSGKSPISVESRLRALELNRAQRDAAIEWDSAGIRRLPFTRQEALGISALISPRNRRLALDFDANRSLATGPELGQYRFVHFATHGFLDSFHPELSGIVLSLFGRRGQPQDGFILPADVFHLRLAADLVVVSGCRTGLGKEIRGEGMVGLTRAFLYAGAARVLVSLWDVDDEATAELMKRFYKGMLGRPPLTPAAALRAAQKSIARDRRWIAPYYWAGFVLSGEPE